MVEGRASTSFVVPPKPTPPTPAHPPQQAGHDPKLGAGKKVRVYGLGSYSPKIKKHIKEKGAEFVAVDDYSEIVPGIYSTGPVKGTFKGFPIWEHSAIVGGKSLITGCAHAGILNLLKLSSELAGRPMGFVLGGFHLMKEKEMRINSDVKRLLEMSLERIAPAHCTGDNAIEMIRSAFGERYIRAGAGTVIDI